MLLFSLAYYTYIVIASIIIPILNNYIDSENGEDTNDDSDIDKSYCPNVAKADSECTITITILLILY